MILFQKIASNENNQKYLSFSETVWNLLQMPASNCIGIKHLFVLYWLSTALGYFIYGMNDEENVVDNVIQQDNH